MEKKLINSFTGTFLEDFFDLKEEEYLEPHLKKIQTEVVIGVMTDAEKRVFTLASMRYAEIKELALKFEVDSETLDNLFSSANEDIFEKILEDAEELYEEQDSEFPWTTWSIFLDKVGSYQRLTNFLNDLIYTRLLPKNICFKPIFRAGFLIVKDNFEVMEDDCSFEDGEKIVSQNFPFN